MFRVPLAEVLSDAMHGDHTHFELVTATVRLDDGRQGTGYTYTGGKGGHAVQAMISHDLGVVAETCDRVAVMYAGKIMEMADTVSLYNNPLHPYSKALIGAYPFLKGERKRLKSIPGAPPGLIDPPPGCRFAPRCGLVESICTREEPCLDTIDGRQVACHMVK